MLLTIELRDSISVLKFLNDRNNYIRLEYKELSADHVWHAKWQFHMVQQNTLRTQMHVSL